MIQIESEARMNYYLLHTTYPILFLSVFARQLCLPVPAILFLISGGTLAGTGRLSFIGILLVAILGCLLGDLVWFEAGRLRGKRVLKLLCAFASDPSYCIHHSRATFAEKGLRILLISKFIPGLDGIMPPLAGMSGTRRTRFLIYDTFGSTLWAGAYICLGFIFAAKLDKVAGYISNVADALVLILGVPLVFFFVWKLIQLLDSIRALRPLHITPAELKTRMSASGRIGVLDLLRFEDDPEGTCAIPGAVREDPARLRYKTRFMIPDDVDLVLYCNSKNNFVTARVAAAMRRQGVQRILILEGGLEAWKAEGFPLNDQFADPNMELRRLGIEMSPSPWTDTKGEASPMQG